MALHFWMSLYTNPFRRPTESSGLAASPFAATSYRFPSFNRPSKGVSESPARSTSTYTHPRGWFAFCVKHLRILSHAPSNIQSTKVNNLESVSTTCVSQQNECKRTSEERSQTLQNEHTSPPFTTIMCMKINKGVDAALPSSRLTKVYFSFCVFETVAVNLVGFWSLLLQNQAADWIHPGRDATRTETTM